MTTTLTKNGHHTTRVSLSEKSRAETVKLLNASLATTLDLQTQTKQAHWNVAGPQFYQLHLLFDKLAEDGEEAVDLIAERILQIGGTALGTARVAAKESILDEYPHDIVDGRSHVEALTERFAAAANHSREMIDKTDDLDDQATSDLYTQVTRIFDKDLWMLEAHLEAK
jgi:starvation-inducible DNA-binding protein